MTDQIETDDDEVVELESRYHRPNCPENDDRLEWEERVVTTQGHPHKGKIVEITRCADCGGQKEVLKAGQ